MLSTRTNFHHSKLPKIGSVVRIPVLICNPNPKRKYRATAYPLSDNAGGYGIHTVFLKALDNGQEIRVSGHYCETL
jgi:hypothetical protein